MIADAPLCEQYPTLFHIVRYKDDVVVEVMSKMPLHISFHRSIIRDKLIAWHNLPTKLVHVQLSLQRDIFRCNLHANGQFLVRSMYQHVVNKGISFPNKFIWRLKVLLKINIFLWYLEGGVILTKDNLVKHSWNGDTQCSFCNHDESTQDLFYCHLTKSVWRVVIMALNINTARNIAYLMGTKS